MEECLIVGLSLRAVQPGPSCPGDSLRLFPKGKEDIVAAANQKLVASLEVLHRHQVDGIVKSGDIGREDRQRLVKLGYLVRIIKGWYMALDATISDGGSTAWFASFWAFVSQYLEKRFGNDYYLGSETSLNIHAGETAIPQQIIVVAASRTIQLILLPHDRSILIRPPSGNETCNSVKVAGVNVMPLAQALCKSSPSFFMNQRMNTEIALRMVRDASELLHILLVGGNSVVASRLIGAYNAIGMESLAKNIENGMQGAGYNVRSINPFANQQPILMGGQRVTSPYAARIEAIWNVMRDGVIETFPSQPGVSSNPAKYLQEVEEIYVYDAYNSLSIEGYRVTRELIEKIRTGNWDPAENENDKGHVAAMAATGYNLAFKKVKESIKKIILGQDAAEIVEADQRIWYSEMFSPSVQAGLLQPYHLAGYRNGQVFIRDSDHVPLPPTAILDAMEALFALLGKEPEASVRAVLGHFVFVFIHPYTDGNGRIGRFFMNTMLASGGYPWTVIRQERRKEYFAALEQASVHKNIRPFAEFVLQEMNNKGAL